MTKLLIKGMDISFWDEIVTEGGAFYENGNEKDLLQILKDSGVNSIRLRLWNDPEAGYVNLERTLMTAAKIKAAGLHFLLDFHYSDYWADPQKQTKPKAWEKLDFTDLVEAVGAFTEQVLTALKEQGTLPDMVQIGNEITPGMLWEEGKVGVPADVGTTRERWIGDEACDNDRQWTQLAKLIQAGVEAVRRVEDEDHKLEVMIHLDRGGDNGASRYVLDRLLERGVRFDVIGQSFYPWWHGTLEDLEANLKDLAVRYGKDLVVVETAYPWTLTPEDGLEFIVNAEDQLLAGCPATVEGQTRYLSELMAVIRRTPDGRGRGFHYWEPAWIPSKSEWSVGHANNWSNLTLFDFKGNRLDSLDVLRP
ncbi:glycoside hydrolase family 53 protein [Paenibacillus glufosinatiresistens]|uniref:glycoside hydrolase family 53 protein n=1 Tax=Paenibacillus glufosinatiresistens TaxID=3070657 RepID=UPI00286DA03D|nr:arabinogalactan endo-1,4-beta-galactosidase [Paenibacillus sp. YX.27]